MATQNRNPASDVSFTGTWTGSAGTRFQLVDDHPDSGNPVADALVLGTTAGEGLFGFTPFSIPAGSTNITVQVLYYDFKLANQACNIVARIRCNDTTGRNSPTGTHNPGNGNSNITLRTDNYPVNPKTSVSWTVDDVNGVGTNGLTAFGVVSTDANPAISISSIQLQVTYTPPNVALTPLSVASPIVVGTPTVVNANPDQTFVLSQSTFIAPSGENTTAQLTPPSGKTTAEFHPGRIQDDHNPSAIVDIGIDQYTEFEWSIRSTPIAELGQTYEFRVTRNGIPLNSYDQIPTAFIAGGAAVNLTPSPCAIAIAIATPLVDVSDFNFTPDSIAIEITVGTPSTLIAFNIAPDTVNVAISIGTPSTTVGAVELTPDAVIASWSVGTPSVKPANIVAPDSISVTWSANTPTTSIGGRDAVPASISAAWSVGTPTVITGIASVTPDPVSISLIVGTPTAKEVNRIEPNPISASWSVGTPTLAVGGVTITPTATAISIVVGLPNTSGGSGANPVPVIVSIAVATPLVQLGAVNLAPDPLGVSWSVATPVFTSRNDVQPDTILASITVTQPTVSIGVFNLLPDAIAVVSSVGTPESLIPGGANVTPIETGTTWVVSVPTIRLGAHNIAPDSLVINWFNPDPTVTYKAEFTPEPVVVVLSVSTPIITATGGIEVTPGLLPIAITVETPVVTLGSIASPNPITVEISAGTPTVTSKISVAPTPVSATWSVSTPSVTLTGPVVLEPSAVSINIVVTTPAHIGAPDAPIQIIETISIASDAGEDTISIQTGSEDTISIRPEIDLGS